MIEMDLCTSSARVSDPSAQPSPALNEVETLYNRNRFIDAFHLCTPYFADLNKIETLCAREITLLGRLAWRLGGFELRTRIFDIARDRAPADPIVRYYAGGTPHARENMLTYLKEIEKMSADAFEYDSDRASWLGSIACTYAAVRDFDTAHRHLAAAFSLNTESAWISCCQAEVLCMEDRWEKASAAAQKAWELSPGMPQGTITLGRILAKTNGVKEAAKRLCQTAGNTQSQESLMTTLWYLCAHAERQSGTRAQETAERALALSKRLESLAPLKDEVCGTNFAMIYTEIDWLRRDFDSMRTRNATIGHHFYETILGNIKSAANDEVIIARHIPVFQKHNTCLPASVATVLSKFDRHIDVDALSEELTFNGTAFWRMVDWLEERGFKTVAFTADAKIASTLLTSELPFVVCVKTVLHYHAMAAIGVDKAAGVLILHDPGQARLEKFLLSELDRAEAPFGLEALAIVPAEKAHLLSLIPKTASEPFSAFTEYQKQIMIRGSKAGLAVIDRLRKTNGDHPFTRRLKALYMGRRGRAAAAIKIQLDLLREFPDCEHIRSELLNNLYQTENTNLIRKVLARLVLKKRLPGFRAAQKWEYPPAEYVAQFATYAAAMDLGNTSVEELLSSAIEREPVHAGCYHALGDYYSIKADIQKSILPYRCAAFLDLENHHYARAYLNALAKVGRTAEGMAFLKRRTEKLGQSIGGGEIWITLIMALEDYGYPDKATTAMSKAMALRPKDPFLLQWAVKFWSRMGEGKKASDGLVALHQSGNRPLFFSASTAFYRMHGQWRKALRHCIEWLKEEPLNPSAMREYLDLYAMAENKFTALSRAEKWWSENRGNDEIEMIFLEQLKALNDYDRQIEIVRARIERNPYDVWARRELGFLLLYVIDIGENADGKAMGAEIEKNIAICKKMAPEDPVIAALEADWAEYHGNRKRALGLYQKAIDRDPTYSYGYRNVWRLFGDRCEAERKALFKSLETSMRRTTGFLHLSQILAKMAAEAFGSAAAHDIVDQWLAKYPEDPEVAKAKIELLLDYGQGRTDARKAVTLLTTYIKRFPDQPTLKFMLSSAYRILQDETNWLKISHAIIRQFPLSSIQRRQLSKYFQRIGNPSKATEALRQGIQVRPLDPWLRRDLIALLYQSGDRPAAELLLKESMAKIPEDIDFRLQMVDLLFENGDDTLAVEAAQGGTTVYPDGALLWKHYGDALWRSDLVSDMTAIEDAYGKALKFNPRLEDAADRLAQLYAGQNRFDRARSVITDQLPHHTEKAALLTRLAWIERQAGNTHAAVKQLVAVVKDWPRERWPWLLLIEWIEADKNWQLAKHILQNVHPVMDEDPDFVSDKLHVLHKAGDRVSPAEWEKLLNDFPEHEKAHCLRFDILLEDEQYDAAEQVLDAIEPHFPHSPYLLARRVALKCAQHAFDHALTVVMKLFQLRDDAGQWCRFTVLQAFRDHNLIPRLISTAIGQWEKGMYIEPNCFRMVIEHVDRIWNTTLVLPRLCERFSIYPQAVKRLRGLLDMALHRDDEQGHLVSIILSRLDDLKQRKFLIKFANRHMGIARSKTHIWQIIGFAYVTGNTHEAEKARKWLEPWRDHEGCEMWIISNLIIAIEHSRKLKRKAKLEQIMREAGDGLRTLPMDNLIQFVVSKYCEAALRLGHDNHFLTVARQYEDILIDTTTGYWFQSQERNLPWVILQFLGLLTSEGHRVKQLTRDFKANAKSLVFKPWVRAEWKKRARACAAEG